MRQDIYLPYANFTSLREGYSLISYPPISASSALGSRSLHVVWGYEIRTNRIRVGCVVVVRITVVVDIAEVGTTVDR